MPRSIEESQDYVQIPVELFLEEATQFRTRIVELDRMLTIPEFDQLTYTAVGNVKIVKTLEGKFYGIQYIDDSAYSDTDTRFIFLKYSTQKQFFNGGGLMSGVIHKLENVVHISPNILDLPILSLQENLCYSNWNLVYTTNGIYRFVKDASLQHVLNNINPKDNPRFLIQNLFDRGDIFELFETYENRVARSIDDLIKLYSYYKRINEFMSLGDFQISAIQKLGEMTQKNFFTRLADRNLWTLLDIYTQVTGETYIGGCIHKTKQEDVVEIISRALKVVDLKEIREGINSEYVKLDNEKKSYEMLLITSTAFRETIVIDEETTHIPTETLEFIIKNLLFNFEYHSRLRDKKSDWMNQARKLLTKKYFDEALNDGLANFLTPVTEEYFVGALV